jgi:K+-sensing histidine kinase KdpD
MRLVAEGPELFAADQRLLRRLAVAAARAWEAQRLAEEAARARQLAEVDRLRSALLAAVGHDLRTPLAGVKAAVSSLRQPDISWSESERAEFLAQIESSADRLGDLLANLLAMSRLQAGVLSVELDAVALDAVVARAVLGLDVDRDGAAIDVDVPDDLPHAHTDDGLLERVVANLVDNARRFSPPDAPVRVAGTVTPDRRHLRLTIVDRGPGVPPEQWEAMFTPFQRLDDRSGPGVGLGLAIARGFTEAVGGTLTPSATDGGGLTMTVTLPVVGTVET